MVKKSKSMVLNMLQSLLFIVFVTCICLKLTVYGQQRHIGVDRPASYEEKKPKIGQPMPYFKLDNVHYFEKKQITLNDFAGKWVFLDFWFKGCLSCIKSFPKINDFQKEFGEKISYILVGLNDEKENKGIEKVYESLMKRNNLNLISTYDSTLAKKWRINSMPHIFIIDPQGTLRYITDGRDLTKDKIDQLLENKKPNLYDKGKDRNIFDQQYFVQQFNPATRDTSIMIRSLLTKFTDEIGTTAPIDVYIKDKLLEGVNAYRISAAPLRRIYFVSELGIDPTDLNPMDSLYEEIYYFPILELKDKSKFIVGKAVDYAPGYYNYSLTVPSEKATKKEMMLIMKSDLKRVFGYNVKIEKRKVPVWEVYSEEGAKELLKTKGGKQFVSDSIAGSTINGFEFHNYPVSALIIRIWFYNKSQPPFIDKTGIIENIDISIDANMTDLTSIKKELKKYKLGLRKAEREMTTMIITDP